MPDRRDKANMIGSEIIIEQTEDEYKKLMLNLKMRPFGLRRRNCASFTKPVNLISVSILSIFLKRKN